MNRKLARELAYKLVFSYMFTKERDYVTMGLLTVDNSLSDEDKSFIADTYDRVIEHYDEIIEIIDKYSIGYDIDRIYKPDLAVLILAVTEMKYNDDVPLGVSIAEAVVIIKKYSTLKSNSFVNGILASVYKELKENKHIQEEINEE